MRNALAMCHLRQTYLYQVCPDIMPYGHLSALEMELWEMYYDDLRRRSKKV